MKFIYILIMLVTTLLAGCTNTGLALLNTQAKFSSDHSVTSNISYGEQLWQKLDLHIPSKKNKTELPVLIFFYGGSWDSGNKEQYFFAARAFTKLGYLVVIPDYVKYPQGKFPTFIEDGATALAWVKQNIGNYGGNTKKLFVVGHSAGAHLGALLVADQSYLQAVDLSPDVVTAFAGLAGPYNFTPEARRIVRVFQPSSNYPKMKVMNHVDGNEPPMFLAHGSSDSTVGVANKDTTIEAIQKVGGKYKDINYQGVSHVGILLSLHSLFDGKATPAKDIDDFFRSYLKN